MLRMIRAFSRAVEILYFDRVRSLLTDQRIDLLELIRKPSDVAQHIKDNVAGPFHLVGTCRMGEAADSAATPIFLRLWSRKKWPRQFPAAAL